MPILGDKSVRPSRKVVDSSDRALLRLASLPFLDCRITRANGSRFVAKLKAVMRSNVPLALSRGLDDGMTKLFALSFTRSLCRTLPTFVEVIGSPKLRRQSVGKYARPRNSSKAEADKSSPGLWARPCPKVPPRPVGSANCKRSSPTKSCFNSIGTFCARTENGSSSASGFCRAGSRRSLMLPDDEKGTCERSTRQHLIFRHGNWLTP